MSVLKLSQKELFSPMPSQNKIGSEKKFRDTKPVSISEISS